MRGSTCPHATPDLPRAAGRRWRAARRRRLGGAHAKRLPWPVASTTWGMSAGSRPARAIRRRATAGAAVVPRRLRPAGARSDGARRPGRDVRSRRAAGGGRRRRPDVDAEDRRAFADAIHAVLRTADRAATHARTRPGARRRLQLGRSGQRAVWRLHGSDGSGPDAMHIGVDARELTGSRPASDAIFSACSGSGASARRRAPISSRSTRPTRRSRCRRICQGEVVARPGRRRHTLGTGRAGPRRAPRSAGRLLRARLRRPLLAPVPLVVVMHDVSFAAHPEWFRSAGRLAPASSWRGRRHVARRGPHGLGVLARRDRATPRRPARSHPGDPAWRRLPRRPHRLRATRWCCSSGRSSTGGTCPLSFGPSLAVAAHPS